MSNPILPAAPVLLMCAVLLTACAGPGRPENRGGAATTGDPALQHGAMVVKPTGLLIADMDTDNNFETDRQELDRATVTLFDQIDQDRGGIISAVEFADWAMINLGTRYPVPGLARFDADASLSIERDEFTEGLRMLFTAHDKDGNGSVERAELFNQLTVPNRGGGSGRSRPGGGPGGGGPQGDRPAA